MALAPAPARLQNRAVRLGLSVAGLGVMVAIACAASQADPSHPLPKPPGDPRGVSTGALAQATAMLEEAHRLAHQGHNAEAASLAGEGLEARALAYGNFSSEMAWTLVWVTDLYIRTGHLHEARRVAVRARDVGQRAELPEVVRIANRRLNKISHLQSP